MPSKNTLIRCDAQELRMTADSAEVRRRDLSKSVLAAIVALVEHDRRTMAEMRELAVRLERFAEIPQAQEKAA